MFFGVWVEEEPSKWTYETERIIANGNLLSICCAPRTVEQVHESLQYLFEVGSSMHCFFHFIIEKTEVKRE